MIPVNRFDEPGFPQGNKQLWVLQQSHTQGDINMRVLGTIKRLTFNMATEQLVSVYREHSDKASHILKALALYAELWSALH
jgi:hypothetical protein